MFSTLKLGNTIHVLEQTDKLEYKTGQIVSILPNFTGGLDMKVKIDDLEYEFKLVPYNQTVTKNGSITISESKDNIVTEIMKLKENSESIVDQKNIDYHNNLIKECKETLRQVNPDYDKEIKRDEEIDALKQQVLDISESLNEIKNLLKSK